jgi:sugar lactone lactonase YvrE
LLVFAWLTGTLATNAPAGATTKNLSIFAGIVGSSSPPCGTSGAATAAKFSLPYQMGADAKGNIYFADLDCYAVYKETPQGVLSVVAGIPGTFGGSVPVGPVSATSVPLYELTGLAVEPSGGFYVSDGSEEAIYKVSSSGILTNVTVAGLAQPFGLALDGSGNLYVANNGSNSILKVHGGTTSVFKSGLSGPSGVATDRAGNVYIADSGNNRILKVNPTGTTTTIVAGTGSTTTPSSSLNAPAGITVDPAGNVFIADTGNCKVDEVTPSGAFSVVAGSGCGTPLPGTPATSSPLYGPNGVTLDPFGNIYMTDGAVVETVVGVGQSAVPTPGTPTTSGGRIVFPWSAVSGASSYTVTVYVNGVAQTPVTGLTGLSYTLSNPTAGASYSFTVAAVIGGSQGPDSARSTSVTASSAGYWTVGADGGVFSFGPGFYGSTGNLKLNQPVFALTSTADGQGYWFVARDGGVFSEGDAAFHGSVPALGVHVTDIVGMAADPATGGYWLVGSDGGVYAFGAPFNGSLPALGEQVTNVVGMAATADGGGYYLVTSTGAVYAFGDAVYQGGANALSHRNAPIVGMSVDPATGGYWLAGSDGGIYAYGAPFHGSAGGTTLNQPVVGISATTDGSGYYLAASDGGVFSYDAPFLGSMGGKHLNAPMVGIAVAG